jgi:DNA-binding transcriptional LysR family regulator
LELRQLQHFVTVNEERSFTRAAIRLHMVQSSLSSSLKALERELGTDVFVRGRRGVELTDAGRELLPHAYALLERAEQAAAVVAQVRGVVRGSVRVATVGLPKKLNVMSVLTRFHDAHPDVRIHLIHDGARDLVALVVDGDVDFAVSPLTHQSSPAVQFDPLIESPLVLICRRDHPLGRRRQVRLDEVLKQEVLDLPPGWWVRDLFDRMLADNDLDRQVHIEIDEWFGLQCMVDRGIGVSYGPKACVDTELFDGLTTVPLVDAPAWKLGIVRRDDRLRGVAGRAFLEEYREHCRQVISGMR